MTRYAINGMGRIGRTLFRVLHQRGQLHHLIAVNDLMPKENLIYLIKYDSIHGTFTTDIEPTPNGFLIDGHEIIYTQQPDISKLKWQQLTIDIVIEATGLFTHSSEMQQHVEVGAKKVLLTTYSKDLPSTIWSVNDQQPSTLVSPGDCTINCVAPLLHIVQQAIGIESVHINVIQGYTTRQQLIDAPYKGLRRGRAAAHSIIPFEVNIRPVLETIFPALSGKIETMSTRVPIPCGALADISLVLKNNFSADALNELILHKAKAEMKNTIAITFDPIVSSDVLSNPHSSLVDGTLTKVTNGTHAKLLAWFDNEWGYSNRLADWLIKMSS
ncbi:MAG: type I glyceraldehyde-3-phosphate dehydrogenase [Cyclobacteriaceae bacterium]|nr:type I glyceraldehyde-3-phosphate dehydrogenase [Cyclobacteriaceae bacterium]